MSSRNTLLTTAKEVHIILNDFLSLQEVISKPGFLGMIKSIFKKTNFTDIYSQVKSIDVDLENKLELVNVSIANTQEEIVFVEILKKYICALRIAVQKFSVVVEKLRDKAQGHELPWSAYSRLMDEFSQAERIYIALGQEMNHHYRRL
ncbi:hypothetical protein [Pelosinus baikalensis]|uniref:Uncharacterized protein n=1 Tax=Pelosinus baikalensis TaxID=2892015 RepID=A0ABS8HYP8_9FIRM|nr:hypothetical protein [Pelosinus baikalensis]MCC5467639.1 hypothetical protein [Pelosinus baikalensis]